MLADMRWARACASGLAVAAMLPAAAAADPAAPVQPLVDGVNARRAQDGMPPLTGDAKMHQGCLNHVDYGLRNFGVSHGSFGPDPHDEDPARPGYTELGRKAANRSILGFGLLNGGRPFHHAPGHLFHFLSPFPLKVGVAERTDTLSNGKRLTLGCMWSANLDADDVDQRRAPANPPRPWSVPFDGQTGVPVWESQFDAPPTLAHEVGLTSDPNGPLLTGPVLHLYHDDVGPARLGQLCQAVLLGPGGQPVPGAAAKRGQFVARDPLLPGARYRHIETFASATGCASDVQRTAGGSFTTSERKGIGDVVRIGDPVRGGSENRWTARVTIGEEIGFFTKGNGTLRLAYDMASSSEQVFPNTFDYGTFDFTLDHGPVGQTLTIEAIPDQKPFGPTCFSPSTIVRRTYRHTSAGVVALGPQEVVSRGPDPCVAPPDATGASPLAGGGGTIVRVDGTGLAQARAVRVGGVAATRWRLAEDGDLLVTVPHGATDGSIEVETPWGTDTVTGFKAAPDTVAPVSEILLGPSGDFPSTTASFAFAVEPGALAECRLDGGAWQPCGSPRRIEGLSRSPHTFSVRGTDAAGNVETSPPSRTWTPTAGASGAVTITDGAVGQDVPPGPGLVTPPPPPSSPSPPPVRARSVLVLRSGPISLRRAPGPVRRRGRVVTLGTLSSARTATAAVTVRAGRRVLLRVRRVVRRGRPVPLRVTLPRGLAARRSIPLTVVLGGRRAVLAVRAA